MQYQYNDGGRDAAGYKGKTGDCVTRAIAIATGKSYQEVYSYVNGEAKASGKYGTGRGTTNARTGVLKKDTRKIMEHFGFKWTPTMIFGQGCTVHLRPEELPSGVIIASVSRHVVAVINSVLNDTYDCSRDGTRCVYGYYAK